MGNRAKSESKRKTKKTGPYRAPGKGSSSSPSPSPAAPSSPSAGTARLQELEQQLRDLKRQEREATAARVQSEKDYTSARRELARALKEFDRSLDGEERQAFHAAKQELDAQRAEVKRLAQETAEHRSQLEELLQQLRNRILHEQQHGNGGLLPGLEMELQSLRLMVDDARQEQGACRQELKLIQADLASLTASKRFADEERRAYHAESQELARRSREWDELDRECRRRDAAWEREYRSRSDEEERLVQEELPLDLP